MLMPTKTQPNAPEISPDRDRSSVRPRRSMILPEAYDERAMPSLMLARSSRHARRIGRVLTVLMIIGLILIVFAPWQQSVRGSGSMIAFSPEERPQVIEAPTKGRIEVWGNGIFENARVEKGDLIARIVDLDPDFINRLQEQVNASEEKITQIRSQITQGLATLAAQKNVVTAQSGQVASVSLFKDEAVASAEAKIESAKAKVDSNKQKVAELEAEALLARQDFERAEQLFADDIISRAKFQDAKRKLDTAKAKVDAANAAVQGAQQDLVSAQRDRAAKEQDAQAKIDKAKSELSKAESDVEKISGEISKYRKELASAQKELVDAKSKFATQQNQDILAPVDGILTQINANNASQVMKPGDPIATIVPDMTQPSVQVWLDGNDAPLVTPGRHVRLQFEGWPAVQFAGWPSVAVGTFGGTVVSVDATDNGKGKFRVLVQPDETDVEWPSDRYLRQGVRANGWVLLDTVPLWFEVWRQLNGFPPIVDTEDDKGGKIKVPKIPKA